MSTVPKRARRFTSPSIIARACAEKTPGPVMRSRAVPAVPPTAACAATNAPRAAAIARACPSVSEPLARERTTRSARRASGDTHTPSSTRGPVAAPYCSTRVAISPVGSRGSTCFTSRPAEEASSASVSEIASRSPATAKRRSETAGLSA